MNIGLNSNRIIPEVITPWVNQELLLNSNFPNMDQILEVQRRMSQDPPQYTDHREIGALLGIDVSDFAEDCEPVERLSRTLHHSLTRLGVSSYPREVPPNHQPTTEDLNIYMRSWTDQYRKHVEALCQQLPPMSPECRISICIPAADREEHAYIEDTLRSFVSQNIDWRKFEVLVFANVNTSDGFNWNHKESPTWRALQSVQADQPNFPAAMCVAELNGLPVNRIGFLRSLISDVALLRASQHPHAVDHLLFRGDADTRGVSSRLIANYLRLAEKFPTTDAFWGQLRWSPEHYLTDPLLLVNQEFDHRVIAVNRVVNGDVVYGGPAFAVRAGSYALLSGYHQNDITHECVRFSNRLTKLRHGSTTHHAIRYAGGTSTVYTSTRRAQIALSHKIPSLRQWADHRTQFQSSIHNIRALKDPLPRVWENDAACAREVQEILNAAVAYSRRTWRGIDFHHEEVTSILDHYFQLQYEVLNEENIHITNSEGLIKRLNTLAAQAQRHWQKKCSPHQSPYEKNGAL